LIRLDKRRLSSLLIIATHSMNIRNSWSSTILFLAFNLNANNLHIFRFLNLLGKDVFIIISFVFFPIWWCHQEACFSRESWYRCFQAIIILKLIVEVKYRLLLLKVKHTFIFIGTLYTCVFPFLLWYYCFLI